MKVDTVTNNYFTNLFFIFIFLQKCREMRNKKDEGNALFKSGKFQEAYDVYTQTLAIDPHNVFTNAKLYCNRL